MSAPLCELPPPLDGDGSISGRVQIEGSGAAGVQVMLSGGSSTTTAGDGSYSFSNVPDGAWEVRIGVPADATCAVTSGRVTVSASDRNVTIDFDCEFLRTASISGTVSESGTGVPGVGVSLSGVASATTTSDASGNFSFTGLRFGEYRVTLSGWPSSVVFLAGTATTLTLATGEAGSVQFVGSPAPVASVEVSPASGSLVAGGELQLTATTRDTAGGVLEGRVVTWSSSDNSRATVSSTGLVLGRSDGSVTITALSQGVTGTATLTVLPVPVATVDVAPGAADVERDKTVQLSATVRASDGQVLTGRSIAWSSSSTAVATVNQTGLVTGVTVGVVTISATSEGRTGTATVTVLQKPVAKVDVTPAEFEVPQGETVQLTAVLTDADGEVLTGGSISWSSSSTVVATVDQAGLVRGVTIGQGTISAQSGGKKGTALVTVTPPSVATVTITPANVQVVSGESVQLTAVLTGVAGDVLTGRSVSWSSSSPAVATVNTTGLVTGAAGGSATITATSEGKSGTATVVVILTPVASVEVSPASPSVGVGQTLQLTATTKDAANNVLSGRTVTWSSSNSSLATVSSTGLVSGVAFGSVVITATSEGKAGAAQVTVAFPFVSVTAGANHTCGVTPAGAAYCWGSGDTGRLGNGNTLSETVPKLVTGGLSFTSLAAGGLHTCGVAPWGAAYCWGHGFSGQLGDGSAIGRTSPTLVSGGLTFASVSAGAAHTCGLTTEGAVYCWGDGASGVLGNGSTVDKLVPTPVSGGLTFKSVTAGGNHTCAVTAGDAAYCWGAGLAGQLGNGSTADRMVPTLVSNTIPFSSMSAGSTHTCGVAKTGAPYCWGDGGFGKLGDGFTSARTTPTSVFGGLTYASLSAGDLHTCGVATSGAQYCWGSGRFGQIGNASDPVTQPVPTMVSGGLTFASMSAGDRHTCGVTTGGAAYCWGDGASGRLGHGSSDSKLVPTLVSPPG